MTLQNLGAHSEKNFSFLDHHVYSKENIEEMIRSTQEHNTDVFVTTQKDAVKLNPFLNLFDGNITLLSLKIQLTIIHGKDDFLDGIDRVLQR